MQRCEVFGKSTGHGNIRVNYGKFAASNLDLLSVLINRLNRN